MISVEAKKADDLLKKLHHAGVETAAIIGEFNDDNGFISIE